MATKPGGPFKRADRRKKLIEMERRHIREGEARVARQEEVVARLDSMGAGQAAITACEILARFRNFLTAAREHLGYLERESSDNPSESN
jgi:hypothetical protein